MSGAAPLSTHDLVAGYERDLPIVKGIDFSVADGEMVAILGPNGAGKSTFVKAVAGTVPVFGGEVRLDGSPVTGLKPNQIIRRGMAFVPQTENIFARLSIRENLQLASAILPRAEQAGRIEAMFAQFPDLAARPGRAAGSLSGGQRQMLAAARALLVSPSVLLLDEPSAGLSPKLVAEVFQTLKAINDTGVTIVLVEQNVRAALKIVSRAVVLVDGRLRYDAPAGDLANHPNIGELFLGSGDKEDAPLVNPQLFMDGLVAGSMIGLGAIGVTLTYSILRFPNFAHGEFIAWGAYLAMTLSAVIGAAVGASTAPLGPFSFGWSLPVAGLLAMILTAGLALLLDQILFKRLRSQGAVMIIIVMASFGASMALRSALEFIYTARPGYFTRELQIAIPLGGGIRATPDQLFAIGLTVVLVVGVHLLLTRTPQGRAMRAVSENPSLAGLVGVDVDKVIRLVWILGAALACAAGVIAGLLVQIRPYMGFDLLLPLFAAAILGGIGSVPGAVIGGLIVGLGEALAVHVVGAEWRAGAAFVILTAILIVRPSGLFGRP